MKSPSQFLLSTRNGGERVRSVMEYCDRGLVDTEQFILDSVGLTVFVRAGGDGEDPLFMG